MPTKRARKHNARPLPEGLTQEMLPKYVVYYHECYNKERQLFREFCHTDINVALIPSVITKFSSFNSIVGLNPSLNTLPKFALMVGVLYL